MSLSISPQIQATPPFGIRLPAKPTSRNIAICPNHHLHPKFRSLRGKSGSQIINAVGESQESNADSEAESEPASQPVELSELGKEIKKAMQERERQGDRGLLSGVAEEIAEIEWPVFGKVLGTTGVVLGVIAGSSVVLLTVNALLAELSDRVFAGKGVQDFFG